MTSVNFTVFVKTNLQTRRFTLSHCSAFGGGKSSAVTSAKKGGRIGFAAEPVDTETKSPAFTVKIEKKAVTPVSEGTADTALILVDG